MRNLPTSAFSILLAAVPLACAQTPDQVLVVVNRKAPVSRQIGEYYMGKRSVPLANLCAIDTPLTEKITREVYDRDIELPIGSAGTSQPGGSPATPAGRPSPKGQGPRRDQPPSASRSQASANGA